MKLLLIILNKIYVNKIENRITPKIKTEYYLEVLTPKTVKLLGRNKSKINKDKNSENEPHLDIAEVVLMIYILSVIWYFS